LGPASVDRGFTPNTEGWCKHYVAAIACCPAWWLASSCDWWRVLVFFDTSPRRMWTLSRDDVTTRPRQQIQNKKFMFTIIWNLTGFYVVDRLPNDIKMNSAYFVTNLLTPLEEAIFPQGRARHQKRLVIHFDNCSVHTSRASIEWLEEHGMRCMPKPPYSPDLASVTSTYFLQWKRNSNGLRLLTKTSFLDPYKWFWEISIMKNWTGYFRLEYK
jgi:transposase InsO family protein